RGLEGDGVALLPALGSLPVDGRHGAAVEADGDPRAKLDLAGVERHDRLGLGRERQALAARTLLELRQVVQTDDHVLRGHGHRTAVRRLEDVVAREHEDAGLGLRLSAQGQVDGHLVAVEVRVERGAHERVQVDGLALDELRLERLDAQTVQGGRTVEQDRVLADDLLEDVPHLGTAALDHALGRLDVLRVVELHEALHDEGLEELERHLLGQTALMQLERGADDDDRTARVVDALAEQVLTETALLALEHVGDRLERAVAGTRDRAAAATVVEQGVDRLLEHALLVVHDDLGRAEVDQPLQAVVAVDDAAVQVVEVGGREAAAVQLDHGTQVRRDDRDRVQHHAGRAVRGGEERVDHLEALEGAGLALALARGDDLAQLLRLGDEVEGL